ncbi:hypothetical protein HRbin29_00589 [bacterium HR29]|nr:hypothetical protein HRbin29_00589 [bacterium HR29]
MVRAIVVEPYYGGSHRAWADGLVRYSRHRIELLTLPEGPWRQRMRRGAQELAERARDLPPPDVIIASDMLDVPAFLALARPWAQAPVLVYFHENQFTYPRLRGTKLNSWFGQINYLSALAADLVAFNSAYHREDFLAALRMLARQPNNWLREEGIAAIEAKSLVLPLGVELAWLDGVSNVRRDGSPRQLLWNHRWEFDKNPAMFARVLERLAVEGVPFTVAVAGAPGLNPNKDLLQLPERLGKRVVHFGYAEREVYGRLLAQSDIVVSTSRHEFFGVATVEAMYAGCIPVAPRRYNYPALVPEEWHQLCLFESEEECHERLAALLCGPLPPREPFRYAAARYRWESVIGDWDEAIEALGRRALPRTGTLGQK